MERPKWRTIGLRCICVCRTLLTLTTTLPRAYQDFSLVPYYRTVLFVSLCTEAMPPHRAAGGLGGNVSSSVPYYKSSVH